MSEIEDYVKMQLKKGSKPIDIEKKLEQAGFNKDRAYEIMEKSSIGFRNEGRFKKIAVLVFFIILIAAMGFYIFPIDEAKDCGYDKECFIKAANECLVATVLSDIGGTIFKISSDNTCSYIKKVEKLSESEPKEIADVIGNKEMSCTYLKGAFNEEALTKITADIENCAGQLKNAIQEITSAEIVAP